MHYKMMPVLFVAVAILLMGGFPKVAAAQSDNDALRAMYQKSATVPTNIPGVHRFPDPPAGFNPVTASEMELASYGFPRRPDPQANPGRYARWVQAMRAARTHWTGQLRETGIFHGTMKPAKLVAPPASGIENAPNTFNSENWSGIVLTNTLTKYNTKTSFAIAESYWNVPFAQEAFNTNGEGNICDNQYDIVSVWNGLDGSQLAKGGNADVLQAGTTSEVYCSGGDTTYFMPYAWFEWVPGGEIAEFYVYTGDDMFVSTSALSATTGQIILIDLTRDIYDNLAITAPAGTSFVGSSAEWIVERPSYECGPGPFVCLYPLANYTMDFQFGAVAFNNLGHIFNAGSQTASTYQVSMYDGSDVISNLLAGTAGVEGEQAITFFSEDCANSGGCD
jgi:hypothetical protein